jgi:putative acetyltransferase
VRPECRGLSIGKKLTEAALTEARKLGYTHMRLDTLAFMTSALTLYRSLGFIDIPPYRKLPASIKQYVCFLELNLSEKRPTTGAQRVT